MKAAAVPVAAGRLAYPQAAAKAASARNWLASDGDDRIGRCVRRPLPALTAPVSGLGMRGRVGTRRPRNRARRWEFDRYDYG
jgi:hypothetical protein